MTLPTLCELTGPILAEHPRPHRLALDFAGWRVDVVSNSAALIDRLREYFRDFPARGGKPRVVVEAVECAPLDLGLPLRDKTREPGKKIKEAALDLADGRVVQKKLTSMVFFFGPDLHLAAGPCLDNDNQVVNFINNRYIEHLVSSGCLLFHAAGVCRKDRGLCLAGFAGMGKSTLALTLMRHNLTFISNDRVMARRENGRLVMHGLAKMPRINPGTVLHNPALAPVIPEAERERFAALPANRLWDLEHKYDAFIDECFGPGRFKLNCTMDALVVLNWRRSDDPPVIREVDIARRNDLLPAFTKELGLFYDWRTHGDDAARDHDYVELLGSTPVLEITGGVDFEAAAKHLVELLGS